MVQAAGDWAGIETRPVMLGVIYIYRATRAQTSMIGRIHSWSGTLDT